MANLRKGILPSNFTLLFLWFSWIDLERYLILCPLNGPVAVATSLWQVLTTRSQVTMGSALKNCLVAVYHGLLLSHPRIWVRTSVWKPILHTVYYSMGIVACTHPLVQSSLRYSSLVANKCYLPAIVLVILCNKLNSTRAQLTVQYSNHRFDICIMCECRPMSFYRV